MTWWEEPHGLSLPLSCVRYVYMYTTVYPSLLVVLVCCTFGAPERAPWMAKPDSFMVPLFGRSEPDSKHCITTFQYAILYIYADCIGAPNHYVSRGRGWPVMTHQVRAIPS